eukprot:gnl/MRDRNA2_/MRDRNA2_168740_c0_seq1.p1 gnl/MRDRNA2_/MRDRNA2_168740_c0~~gnl/MRDRNA2_/MRDRNA2_168740_c0_seq1.p1  ORF type:complete len:293 (+),score=63.74 gnl/MRDRNA2_/MRDRNA2_168740_c0_seq1:128-880(+)
MALGKPGNLVNSPAKGQRPPFSPQSRSRSAICQGSALPRARTQLLHCGILRPDLRINVQATASSREEFGLEPDVEKRFSEGSITFYDYMKAMKKMNDMRRAVNEAAKEPGLFTAPSLVPVSKPTPTPDEGDKKVQRFQSLVDAMTEEERSKPDVFFVRELSPDITGASRISRIAESTSEEPEFVESFLYEFSVMRAVEYRLAKGEKMEDIQKEMEQAQQQPQTAFVANRAKRREMKKKEKKPKEDKGGFR